MAKITKDIVQTWSAQCDEFLANLGLRREHIIPGKDAWAIAHKVGITREAYAMSRDVTDAHIQTALQKIFPSAVFLDPKRY